MKQVILLLAIHLLIYHQYQKDKKQSPAKNIADNKELAAKNNAAAKRAPASLLAVKSYKADNLSVKMLTIRRYDFAAYGMIRFK